MILKSLRTISLTVLILSTSLLSGCQKAESTSLKPSKEMTSSVDKEITTYEEAIESNPDIILSYISLGHLYLQKIRETADISYYAKIETLMNEAERSDPDDPDIYALRAQVLIGQHRFREGNALIKKSVALNPTKASFQGILGDSEIELGNYTGAVDAFQKMVDIRPDYSSHMRIAYIRELYGDRAGAEESIRLALKMGNTIPENMAFTHVELGKLIMRRSLEESKGEFISALETVPDYPPALEGMGKIAYFQNDYPKAKEYFQKAYDILPIAQYLIDLSDMASREGNISLSNQLLTLAELSFVSSSKTDEDNDLEFSSFLLEHDMQKELALEKALRAYESRPNIFAADNLAWAYYKNDRIDDALSLREKAFLLGENDTLILYHQGMISLKNNNPEEARKHLSRALTMNPYFSLLDSGKAQNALNSLK